MNRKLPPLERMQGNRALRGEPAGSEGHYRFTGEIQLVFSVQMDQKGYVFYMAQNSPTK